MKMIVSLAYFFAALLVAAVVVELVPALNGLEAWMEDHQFALLLVTGGLVASGVALLIGSVLMMMMDDSTPVSESSGDEPGGSHQPGSTRQFTFREVKDLVTSAGARRPKVGTRGLGAVCGGMLILVGVPGVIIVVAPMALKLLVAGALGYALVRIGWGIARA